jgi:hypothetical protein
VAEDDCREEEEDEKESKKFRKAKQIIPETNTTSNNLKVLDNHMDATKNL